MTYAMMKNLIVFFITLFLYASPIEPSSNPTTDAHNMKGEESYRKSQPTTAFAKISGQIRTSVTAYDQKPLCTTNTTGLVINGTLLNSTDRNSSSHGCHDQSINSTEATSVTRPLTLSDKFAITAFVFILLIGTFGNAYVIYTFTITFKKRTVTETMLIYLAFVDFFASFINPLLFIYWITTRFMRWDFGIIGCKILPPVGPISTTASSAIIIIIFIDRYRSIVTPFRTRFSKLQVHILCILGILTSVVFYSYYISALTLSPSGKCQVPRVNQLEYSVPNVVVTLIWDLAYIVIFIPTNVRIFMHLKLSRELQTDVSFSKERKRGNRKIMRILLTVGVVFAILVFPKDILHLVFTISWMFPKGIARTPALVTLNSWFKVLQVSNSCVNIFIYSKMHNRFRSEITNLFRRLLRRPEKRLEHDSYEDKTNVSIDYSEGVNGGLLRRVISDKIAKRLSPKFKRRIAYNDNGELNSYTNSPRLRRSDENGLGDNAKRKKASQSKFDGKMDSPNGSMLDKRRKSDKRPLIDNHSLKNGHLNVDSDDEVSYKKIESSKEPRSRREDMRKGLMRMIDYTNHNKYENNVSKETVTLQLSSNARGDGATAENGKEIAKILECYKKSGIQSRETHC